MSNFGRALRKSTRCGRSSPDLRKLVDTLSSNSPGHVMDGIFVHPVRNGSAGVPILTMATYTDTSVPLVGAALAEQKFEILAVARFFVNPAATTGLPAQPTAPVPGIGTAIQAAALGGEFVTGPNSFGDWVSGLWNAVTDVAAEAVKIGAEVVRYAVVDGLVTLLL